MPKEKAFLKSHLIIVRKYRLLQLFIPIQLCGFTCFFDKKTRRYVSILVRLIDKAILNYNLIVEHTVRLENRKDIDFQDFLNLNDYAEVCISAIGRAIKIIESITVDNSTNLKDFIDLETLNAIKYNKSIIDTRNRIEHINEDIQNELLKDGENHTININDGKNRLSIGKDGTGIELSELKSVLEKYNEVIVNVFKELPDKHTEDDNVFYKNGEVYTRKVLNKDNLIML